MSTRYICVGAVFIFIAVGGVAVLLLREGERSLGALENIQGIPFPRLTNTLITEALAHQDMYLQEPTWGKAAVFTITFIPHEVTALSMGVRQDSFWLSYPRHEFYHASSKGTVTAPQTAQVRIPLTTALQDADNSLDTMLFADFDAAYDLLPGNQAASRYWEVIDMQVRVERMWPSWVETKDYLKSTLWHEQVI